MSWVKKQDDRHTTQAWGGDKPGYADRGREYESDAKVLAGKEKREMAALFGKSSSSSSSSSSPSHTSSYGSSGSGVRSSPVVSGNVKKLASSGPSAGTHALPSIFRNTQDGVPLGNMGSAATMERSGIDKTRDINFGSKASGGTGSSGSVSKLSMGSAGIMERASIDKTRDINFGAKAGAKKW